MTLAYGHIAQRLFDTPLMYDERKAEAFLVGLGGRIAGAPVVITNGGNPVDHTAFENGRVVAGHLGDRMTKYYERGDQMPFYMDGAVAIIPIEGSLVHKGAFVGQSSGETSYEGLQAQITIATRSPKVRGVVFEVDSYGGEVSGAYETAELLAQLSKVKPTIAILTDFAYSAAYLLASQARQIIAPEFGGAGSIGTILLHADYSEQLAMEGIKVTIIRAGMQKARGNPYEPLPEDLADRWLARCEEMRVRFAEFVGRGRAGRFSKAKAMKTEAEAYDAKQSLSMGLIDAIANPAHAYEAFAKEINRI